MLELENRAMRRDLEANAKVECVSGAKKSGERAQEDGERLHERGAMLNEGAVRLNEGGVRLLESRSRLREVGEGENAGGERAEW